MVPTATGLLACELTQMPRWRVHIIRIEKPEHLGVVTAPNAQEALNRAASLLKIEAQERKFMITKIEEYELGRYTE